MRTHPSAAKPSRASVRIWDRPDSRQHVMHAADALICAGRGRHAVRAVAPDHARRANQAGVARRVTRRAIDDVRRGDIAAGVARGGVVTISLFKHHVSPPGAVAPVSGPIVDARRFWMWPPCRSSKQTPVAAAITGAALSISLRSREARARPPSFAKVS